ncbi:hypothetical protein RFI_22979 [Reticulomyxa filosa]|uniref:Uncharacterized protein n=1 Tax=Reticulomyxa filosa TaxID=46433 RepID=X6MKN8_RETFI|nr:hypothetical protein RFI_22979 [Reticulomyxa filosa]|eukprot:ETO14389.1 hypothetical protein RFI_22979 [Reticulomyxa filosa]
MCPFLSIEDARQEVGSIGAHFLDRTVTRKDILLSKGYLCFFYRKNKRFLICKKVYLNEKESMFSLRQVLFFPPILGSKLKNLVFVNIMEISDFLETEAIVQKPDADDSAGITKDFAFDMGDADETHNEDGWGEHNANKEKIENPFDSVKRDHERLPFLTSTNEKVLYHKRIRYQQLAKRRQRQSKDEPTLTIYKTKTTNGTDI